MYGIVVMAALTAGGESPDFGKARANCYGCYGYGCYSAPVGHTGLNAYYSSCSGCCGVSCYGCCSGWSSWSPGSCYGQWNYGSCYGCYGTWSCSGCYGCCGQSPYSPIQNVPIMPPADGGKSGAADQPGRSLDTERARMVIELPADAKLYIDDQPMKATSAVRSFHTPKLEPGAQYYYILKVELVRDNTTLTETRKVVIKAGDELKAAFTEGSIAAATKSGNTAAR